MGGGAAVYIFYLSDEDVFLDGKRYKFLYIPSQSTYNDLLDNLEEEHFIHDVSSFRWLARVQRLEESFHPGRYRVTAGMTNRQLINLIKSGKQELVKVIITSALHSLGEIRIQISSKLESTANELDAEISERGDLQNIGNFKGPHLMCLFIPETYQLTWNTPLHDFISMVKEHYQTFWNLVRIRKAAECHLSPEEVFVLASIVQSESFVESEQRKIAGVYINRLKRGMPLQADPTLIFAQGDFSRKRVLNADRMRESPYNTYLHKGLPPGPIALASSKAIDAVLNHERHSFLYFCAKPQLNGFSDYSTTYNEHLRFAEMYRKEMDRRGILK